MTFELQRILESNGKPFEQMNGRHTRALTASEMQAVSTEDDSIDHLVADNVFGAIYCAFGDRLWPLK